MQFRDMVRKDLVEFAGAPAECKFCDWLIERLYYMSGDLKDAAVYDGLKAMLGEADQKHGTKGNYLYYLATAPALFGVVVEQLGAAGLVEESGGHWRQSGDREAVRARPRFGARAQSRNPDSAQREADLSHRSLSR